MEKAIHIFAQAFYGNRTETSISTKNIDRFILGCMSDSIPITEPIDRTIVPVPGTDNLVIVYNKYTEAKRLTEKAKVLLNGTYQIKALAMIPETGMAIFSRCIGCRVNSDGTLESLEPDDYAILLKYFMR